MPPTGASTDAGALPFPPLSEEPQDTGEEATPLEGADAGAPEAGAPRPVDTADWQPSACLEGGWCWFHPLPHGEALTATWGVSGRDFWTGSGGNAPFLAHWDGRRWSAWSVPGRIRAMWGSAADDVWAVGSGAFHWNGNRWKQMLNASLTFTSLWGTGPSSVWGVAGSRLLAFDGHDWSDVATPPPGPISHVWASSPEDLWVAGPDSALFHWDGQRWRDDSPQRSSSLPGSTTDAMTALWGSGPNDVWASRADGTLFHFDGQRWAATPQPHDDVRTRGLPSLAFGGSGPSDVWARGGRIHWDGTAWTLAQVHAFAQAPGIGAAGGDTWFVGSGADPTAPAPVLLLQGGEWWNLVPDATVQVTEVLAPAVGEAWFNGARASGEGVVLHWKDERLTRVPELEAAGLQVLHASAPDDVWAAGSEGRTAHWDGSRWVLHRSSRQAACAGRPGACQVVAMWGAGSDVWAIALRWQDGAPQGLSLHWDGQRWQRAGTESRLGERWPPREVRMTGPNEAWAYGERSLLRWDGSHWSEVLPADAQVPPSFVDLKGFAAGDVWALEHAGVDTRLWHWDGARWSVAPTPEGFSAERLWGTAGSDVFAVGARGLFHWDGREWSRELAGTELRGMGGSRTELFLLRNGGALRKVRSAPRVQCKDASRCTP